MRGRSELSRTNFKWNPYDYAVSVCKEEIENCEL